MWIILHWLPSYECFVLHRSVNREPGVWSDTCSSSKIGLRIFPSFALSQATSTTFRWDTFLPGKYHPEYFPWGKYQHERVTSSAHEFLCYARATDQQEQHKDPTVHLHSRNSNVKCFAGYMLFLEEQLEARATGLTICLFDKQQLHRADLED